jgi:hypothetical protein
VVCDVERMIAGFKEIDPFDIEKVDQHGCVKRCTSPHRNLYGSKDLESEG